MKIAVIGKPIESAVTYYRATVPFAELCRSEGWQFVIFMPKDVSADVLHYFDLVFLHRPIHPSETATIWMCKQAGVKCWVDIDDLLWKIPLANPANSMFSPQDRQELMKAMINADVISCSTPGLADAIEKEYGRAAHVIPNAWNDRAGEMRDFNPNVQRKHILWRGSNTHDGDLFLHRSAFRPYDNIDFSFMGTLPWYFAKGYGGSLPVIRHERWTNNTLSYFARIREINPTFFIVPLEDNDFNAAKSNIAAIEATDAGAVTIYPSYMQEFAKFPGVPYDDPAHLCKVLSEIDALSASAFMDVYRSARKYVETNLKLSEVNRIRKEIICQICV